MTHKIDKLYELMPKRNCGLCDNPRCATLARKIAKGETRPESCVILSKGNLKKIEKILSEGFEKIKSSKEKEERYIKPCTSERGRVMLETRVGGFDKQIMCGILELLKETKCSEKLGVAKIEHDGKTIIVNHNGRISIRKAKNRGDALNSLGFVKKILLGATLCENCNNAVIECVSGGCSGCFPCPVSGRLRVKDFQIDTTALDKTMKKAIALIKNNDNSGLFLLGVCFNAKRIKQARLAINEKELNKIEREFSEEANAIVKNSLNPSKSHEKIARYKKLRKKILEHYKRSKGVRNNLVEIHKIAANGFYNARAARLFEI